MRVLITGGDGFLGRVLSLRLVEIGHDVVIVGRRSAPETDSPAAVRRVYADITDRAQVTAALAGLDVDGVCHLAARTNILESFADPLGYFSVNLGGTLHLLETLTAGSSSRLTSRRTTVVLVSSGTVYGSRYAGPLVEDLVPRPESPYAASKLAAESLVASVADAGSIAAVILRCFNIAGAYAGRANRNPTGIIPATLRAAAGDVPHVVINGDGSAIREFTHVLDVANAIVRALDTAAPGKAEVLNVGTGVGITVLDIVATAARVTGRHIDVTHRCPANEAHTVLADTRRIRERLGWAPARSDIEEIIQSDWEARWDR